MIDIKGELKYIFFLTVANFKYFEYNNIYFSENFTSGWDYFYGSGNFNLRKNF